MVECWVFDGEMLLDSGGFWWILADSDMLADGLQMFIAHRKGAQTDPLIQPAGVRFLEFRIDSAIFGLIFANNGEWSMRNDGYQPLLANIAHDGC